MNRIMINGDRSYLPIDGINRYLMEMVRSLDVIVKNGRYVLVIPYNVDREFYDGIKYLKNIKVKKLSYRILDSGHFFILISLGFFHIGL